VTIPQLETVLHELPLEGIDRREILPIANDPVIKPDRA
jgi:hypothetical protein